jgi:hypothetical protein
LGSDGRNKIFVPDKAWLDEFAADQFALRATMIAVSNGVELKFADFEKAIHHLTLWQFVIKYLYLGNLFRHDQDRSSHPSDHNRVDMLVLQLEPLGLPIFGDWKSGALATMHGQYTKLFSPEFARIHRLMAERVQQPQPIVWSTRNESISRLLDKPDSPQLCAGPDGHNTQADQGHYVSLACACPRQGRALRRPWRTAHLETQNPPWKAGRCPANPGKLVIWTIAIFPENLNRCKRIFACGEALSEIGRSSGG